MKLAIVAYFVGLFCGDGIIRQNHLHPKGYWFFAVWALLTLVLVIAVALSVLANAEERRRGR